VRPTFQLKSMFSALNTKWGMNFEAVKLVQLDCDRAEMHAKQRVLLPRNTDVYFCVVNVRMFQYEVKVTLLYGNPPFCARCMVVSVKADDGRRYMLVVLRWTLTQIWKKCHRITSRNELFHSPF